MDALRGVASMYVALFHFNVVIPFKSGYWRQFCEQGWLGVPVFFVISGWCMAMIIPRERSALAFIIKRLLRIYPPYWVSLGIIVGIAAWRWLSTGTNDVAVLPKSPLTLLATATLWTSPASQVPTINWVYWSLTYEVTFYVLIWIGLIVRRPTLLLVALLPLSLLGPAYFQNHLFGSLLFFTDQYPLFLLGFLGQGFKKSTLVLGLIGLAAIICFFAIRWLPANVGILTLVLLIWSKSGLKNKTNFLLPLAKVGDWSYSLYLIHVPVAVYILARYCPETVVQNTFYLIIYDLAVLAICLCMAWLIHLLVEKPSHQLAQRLSRMF